MSSSAPPKQRRLLFAIMFLLFFVSTLFNLGAFIVNWEDIIDDGVRTVNSFWDIMDKDCEGHPWTKQYYLECQQSSGVGAVAATVTDADCRRVCHDTPCAGSRLIAAKIIIWCMFFCIVAGCISIAVTVGGIMCNLPLVLMAICIPVTLVFNIASWLPFWLYRNGYQASCSKMDYCPPGALRCTFHGPVFMFCACIALLVAAVLYIFFDCFYFRFCAPKPTDGYQANENLKNSDHRGFMMQRDDLQKEA